MIDACTIIAGNYAASARVLVESFFTHHPDGSFTVLVVDDEQRDIAPVDDLDRRVVWWRLRDLGLDTKEIHRLAAIYDVTELSTSVKPLFLQVLMRARGSVVIYLDPDIRVFGSLAYVTRLADEHGLVLTPHMTRPIPDDRRGIDALFVLAAGVYNLGFVAVAPGAEPCLEWWWQQTRRRALNDVQQQMFTDQRWADYIPSLFSHHLLKDPGYNVAYWNLHERPLTRGHGRVYARNAPLRFFHFSGYDPSTPWLLSRHQGDRPRILLSEQPVVAALCEEYAAALDRAGLAESSRRRYGWDISADGLEMTRRIRRLLWTAWLAAERGTISEPPDPFDTARPEAFTAWLNAPDERGPRLWSRYLGEIYRGRVDVQAHMPDIDGIHAARFGDWVRTRGVVEERLPCALIPRAFPADARQDGPAEDRTKSSPSHGLNLAGYFHTESGIGEAARLLTRAIGATGSPYAIATQDAPLSRQLHQFEADDTAAGASFDVNLLCVNADVTPAFAGSAGPSFFARRHTIGYWFWEVDPLPAAMHAAFDHVDEVWTASEYVAGIVRTAAAGRRPVFTVPLPLVPPCTPRAFTREQLGLPTDRFIFLFVFDFLSVMERKNPIGAIEAFSAAFAPGEGPVLVLKSINGNARISQLERLRRAAAHRSDIVIRDGYVSADEKNALIAACDCYVSLHRAEGLGLTLAEAMTQGRPAIATGYTGNRHFMTEENSFLVDYRLTQVSGDCGPYTPDARWAEPDLNHAAQLMRTVYEHPSEAARRAERARADLLLHHSLTASASAVSNRLEQIREARQPTMIQRLKRAAQPTVSRGTRRDLWVSLLIALCCLVVYNANGRAISAGDAFPARYQPFAIWKYHTVLLDPIETLTSQGRERPTNWQTPPPGAAYWIVPARDGHLASLYPPVLPVLIAPLYLPAFSYVSLRGWSDVRVDIVARIMEKLTASFVAALSASLLYLALRRRAKPSVAILLTVAYAFGTTTWVISSQALWQHGMGQLLVVGLILLLTAPSTAPRALAAGLLCGLMAGNRAPDAVLAAALGVYALFWAGRRAGVVIAAAAVPVLLVIFYNVAVVGAVGGSYELVGHADRFFSHDPRTGLAGLLFSPTRGLFVFSPFLLFLVLAWRHRPRDRAEQSLTLAMGAGVIVQVLLYSVTDWRGGISWGPRFLTDLLPLLMWMLAPIVAVLGRRGRASFVAAVCVSIAIESVGAFAYTGVTDAPIYTVASGPDKLRAAWDWRNAPFIASLSRGFAPAEITQPMRGSLDAVEVDGRATDTIVAGQDVVASGWALAGRHTPLQVGITIDGREQETTAVRTFFDRPDVRHEFSGAEAAGWSIPLKTAGLPPGQHRLSLYLWASEKGDAYFLANRTLTVQTMRAATAEHTAQPRHMDLGAGFATAAARIRQHQQEPGYWLTSFTGTPRFEQPHDEMNTFLTSLLVDLIDPMSTAAGLAENAQRARRHLTAQIEPGGLVRYHGLPDAPSIGTLGCAITPDTDDTALVWRIAPAQDRRRLSSALTTLGGYRTRDGLYRTWLAPRSAYQCLDPGSDPNPTDIGIQMHLLQLLLKEQPPAGRALCEALGPRVDDDRIWVYYRLSPLVPILRTAALEQAGCQVKLPGARMQTTVPGQQIWVSVVDLLSRVWRPGVQRPDAAEVDSVLHALANADFALVRQTPPLLYHNDLTATVRRYYWSEDVGYALWLRLAQDAAHIARSK